MSIRAARAIAVVLLMPLLLSGCAVSAFVRVVGDAPAQPTTAAGRYYLDTICPRNAATYRFDAVRKTRDLATLHRAAAAAALASADAAQGLRADGAPWPASIRGQVALLAQSLDLDERSYDELVAAPTLQAAWAVPFPGDTSAGDARFTIRRAIGLSDGQQYDDCVGHYDGSSTDSSTGSTTT